MSRLQLASIAVAALLSLPLSPVSAQEIIEKVRYKGGHAGWGEREIRGTMILDDSTVTFEDRDGRRALTLPIVGITDIERQTQRKEASVGSKLLFGELARTRQEEFVTLSYETPDDAGAIVFRFEPHTSAGMVAKLRYRMRQLGMTPPPQLVSAPVTAAP